jgi:hypothetical protein
MMLLISLRLTAPVATSLRLENKAVTLTKPLVMNQFSCGVKSLTSDKRSSF